MPGFSRRAPVALMKNGHPAAVKTAVRRTNPPLESRKGAARHGKAALASPVVSGALEALANQAVQVEGILAPGIGTVGPTSRKRRAAKPFGPSTILRLGWLSEFRLPVARRALPPPLPRMEGLPRPNGYNAGQRPPSALF